MELPDTVAEVALVVKETPLPEVTIVLYDNWNEKIINDYNTLRDA